ncbi:GTP cyclohydrolase 1 feedback regulatory protein-like [Sycon ciliatum]|uniref:GTP cyclohydrolase 1 feedback regulatory protein-like n=1 Tax=Sycon ciliatum TaxID=27933 RepID=UPI0031F70485
MPYVVICCLIRTEAGPTICGGADSDADLMEYLGASLVTRAGNNFPQWVAPTCPAMVLDKLESCGYTLVTCAGTGQTIVWTLHKSA